MLASTLTQPASGAMATTDGRVPGTCKEQERPPPTRRAIYLSSGTMVRAALSPQWVAPLRVSEQGHWADHMVTDIDMVIQNPNLCPADMCELLRQLEGGRDLVLSLAAVMKTAGLLRCPRCLSRLVSCRGRLHERQGPDAILWVPHKQSGAADAEAVASAADAPAPEAAWDWTEQQHTWWWSVADMEEVPRCVETLPMWPPWPHERLVGREAG